MSRTASQHRPPGIPNGWFAVAFSRDLVEGDVQRVRYFDEEMVLFRTRSGRARLLDAYCMHLGAHLAEGGRVVGESVRCPFHGWCWDGETGECVEIPYCKRIPARARAHAWDVTECNGMIFAWHHAEGKPPSWQVPELPEFHDPEWTEPRAFELKVPVHMQDMGENNCDPVHFQFVHQMDQVPPGDISYAENGRFMRMRNRSEQVTPLGTFEVELEREAWGIGLVSVRLKGVADAGLLMYSSTTPIDAGHTHSRWLFLVTRNLADVAGEEWIANMKTGVMQDMRIWKNKVHRPQPVFCEADDYLAEFRKWADQFYSDSQKPAGPAE